MPTLPLCGPCSRIYPNGFDHPPRRRSAAVLWTNQNGYSDTLCEDTLNIWLDNADDDFELEPDRVAWLDGSLTLAP